MDDVNPSFPTPPEPPPAGALDSPPLAPPRERGAPRRGWLILGAAAVALAAGAGGGYLWGNHNGQSSASAAAGSSSSSSSGGPPGQGQLRNGAVGEVVKVDGSTITLSTAQGDVTVTLRPDTRITKTQTGSAQDIQNGLCVLANGTRDGSSVTAQNLTITQPGPNGCQAARGFGGGGRPGGGPDGATPRPGG